MNIENFLSRRLGEDRVSSINIVPGMDENGDQIVRIEVIYREDQGLLATEELLDLAVDLHKALMNTPVPAFPVISYVSDKDANGLVAAE